jgi:lipid-binding SYLF domain-containing protein
MGKWQWLGKWQSRTTAQTLPRRLAVFMLIGLAALVPAYVRADDALDARHLAEKAQLTLETFSKAPDMDAFRNLIKSAQGVFIAPLVLKGAFIVGAAGGSGVFVARDTLSGRWLGPAFYTVGEGSFGLQIGGSASEIVLLAMSQRGVSAFLESNIKLGADIGVAMGPVGIGAAASTANLSADIVSFSRSKGLYGGISLDGAVVKTRSDWNNAYYGGIVTPTDIFRKRIAASPQAVGLLEEVSKLAGGGGPPGPAMQNEGKKPTDAQGPAEVPQAPADDAQAPAEGR